MKASNISSAPLPGDKVVSPAGTISFIVKNVYEEEKTIIGKLFVKGKKARTSTKSFADWYATISSPGIRVVRKQK